MNILKGLLFLQKSFIIDVRLGYIQASENIDIFNERLSWSKLSRLLQRIAFSCYIYIGINFQVYVDNRDKNAGSQPNSHKIKAGKKKRQNLLSIFPAFCVQCKFYFSKATEKSKGERNMEKRSCFQFSLLTQGDFSSFR